MEDTLVFVDDGFFGLVKKHFQKEDGKSKKYLQTFRNTQNYSLNISIPKNIKILPRLEKTYLFPTNPHRSIQTPSN